MILALVVGMALLTAALMAVLLDPLRRSLLDVPNERSSHTVPTPRGGGVAIAISSLGGLSALTVAGVLGTGIGTALVVGGIAIAAVGFADDRWGIHPVFRFTIHLVASVLVVATVGGMPTLTVGTERLFLGDVGFLVAVLGIAWITNLFNFMDGIDGLAAAEAVLAAGVAALLLLLDGHVALAMACGIVAGAGLGFLPWNWSPARVFMGDVGSGLLGFLLGSLILVSERAGALPALIWTILLTVFVVDATATLMRRLFRGEKLHRPHRRHAYQRLAASGLGHARTTLLVTSLNVVLAGLATVAHLVPSLFELAVTGAVLVVGGWYVAVERVNPMPHSNGDRDYASASSRGSSAE